MDAPVLTAAQEHQVLQVLLRPEDLCTIRDQTCTLFVITHNHPSSIGPTGISVGGLPCHSNSALRRRAPFAHEPQGL